MIVSRAHRIGHVLKNPAVLCATLLLCLNLALSLWGSLALAPQTRRLTAELARQKSLLAKRSDRHEHDDSKEALYQRNDQALQEFFAGFPPHAELPALIEELFSYANELGLAIDAITYRPKNLAKHQLVQYALSFQLEGTYDQIKHMIFFLENSPRIMALNSLQFHQRGAQSRGVVLGLNLETYFDGEKP
jgi:Tfp pilus assembly protein PilO